MKNLRRYATYAIATMMFGVFFYGMFHYPDAPIRPCINHGYCGKQGQPHSVQEFSDFKLWETTLMWAWPIGMLALFFLKKKK
jgi:hypothetical protein